MKKLISTVLGALALVSVAIAGPGASPGGKKLLLPAAFAQTAKKELPQCLAEIAKAGLIEDAALPTAKSRGNLLAAIQLGVGARDSLVDLVQSATPAGRLISLALLKKIDASEYKKLSDNLKQEMGDQAVSYVSPTERCHYSVSDILNDMASKKPLIKILPQ